MLVKINLNYFIYLYYATKNKCKKFSLNSRALYIFLISNLFSFVFFFLNYVTLSYSLYCFSKYHQHERMNFFSCFFFFKRRKKREKFEQKRGNIYIEEVIYVCVRERTIRKIVELDCYKNER